MHVKATNDAELAKYKGQLRGKIVIMQAPRAVRMLDGRIILRMGDAEWNEAMTMPEPVTTPRPEPTDAQRAALAFQQSLPKFLVDEGVAVLLERGSESDETPGGSDLSWMQRRVDGGTIFPSNGGSRDAQAPQQVPSATLAVEHYNRVARLIDHGQPVRMEVNIKTTFHPETAAGGNGINTIAEIPGTDLAARSGDARRALRQLALRHGRHRQRRGIGGDDGGRAGDSDARPEAAPHHPRRAVGGRGAGPARLARLRAAALLRRGHRQP